MRRMHTNWRRHVAVVRAVDRFKGAAKRDVSSNKHSLEKAFTKDYVGAMQALRVTENNTMREIERSYEKLQLEHIDLDLEEVDD